MLPMSTFQGQGVGLHMKVFYKNLINVDFPCPGCTHEMVLQECYQCQLFNTRILPHTPHTHLSMYDILINTFLCTHSQFHNHTPVSPVILIPPFVLIVDMKQPSVLYTIKYKDQAQVKIFIMFTEHSRH